MNARLKCIQILEIDSNKDNEVRPNSNINSLSINHKSRAKLLKKRKAKNWKYRQREIIDCCYRHNSIKGRGDHKEIRNKRRISLQVLVNSCKFKNFYSSRSIDE